jgi:hypothetical protein
MLFDIYGHYEVDVIRDGAKWKVFNLGEGKRILLSDLIIPSEVQEHEIATYLDDLFHELAKPGQKIRRVG